MENNPRYIIVGLIVVISIISAVLFSFWIHATHRSSNMMLCDIYFAQGVSGLIIGSPVKYQGLLVGSVDSLDLDPENPDKIRVRVHIDRDVPLREGSFASLSITGISGDTYVQISAAQMDKPKLKPLPGNEIIVIPSSSSILEKLMDRAPQVLDSILEATNRMQLVFDQKNREHLTSILENVETFSSSLANKAKGFEDIIDHTNSLIPVVENSVLTMKATVKKTGKSVDQLTGEVTDMIKENRVPLHNFTTGGLYEISRLISEFRKTLDSFDLFMGDISSKLNRLMPDNTQGEYKLNEA